MLSPVVRKDRVYLRSWLHATRLALRCMALLALLVPVVGPLVNLHYAQLQLFHGHIYVGTGYVPHDHYSFAQAHEHHAHGASPFKAGVFSVPDNGDWFPQTSPMLGLLLLAVPVTLSARASGNFERVTPEPLLAFDELFLPLPDNPPR